MRAQDFTMGLWLLIACSTVACGDNASSGGGGNDSTGTAGATGGTTSSASVGGAGGGEGCGDGACTGEETCANCESDCGACCGDGVCAPTELCGTCAADCGACVGDPIEVVRGPYLQSGTSTSAVVRWRTADPTESVVAFGPSPAMLSRIATTAGSTTEHEVTLTGLSPNTKYHYAFGTPESALVGGDADHYVLTAPPLGVSKPTRMWVLGDSGTANQNARDVRDAYLGKTGARGTDLWLMLGDNAYTDGTDDQYQDAVFDMYPEVLRNVVLYTTLGNHDGHSADSSTQSGPYYDMFTLPKQGEAGGVASGTEAYYAFDYGQIHFVCLDSYDSDTSPSGPMMTWLENDLAANTQPWLIAFFHHPPYTKASHDSDAEGDLVAIRRDALPILESHGVDLVLTGHSHAYERSKLIHGHYGLSGTFTPEMAIDAGDGDKAGDGAYSRAPNTTEGAVYVVAGSGGQIGGGSLNHPAMFVSLNKLGSMLVDIDGTSLDAIFIDDTGAVLDTFAITK